MLPSLLPIMLLVLLLSAGLFTVLLAIASSYRRR